MERNNQQSSASNQALNIFGFNWPELVHEAKRRRKEQKLSQERFAAFVGISKPTLVRFEKGETDIQLSTAVRILNALGIRTGL